MRLYILFSMQIIRLFSILVQIFQFFLAAKHSHAASETKCVLLTLNSYSQLKEGGIDIEILGKSNLPAERIKFYTSDKIRS